SPTRSSLTPASWAWTGSWTRWRPCTAQGRNKTKRRQTHMLFIEYPKCSTCRRAKKHLEDAGIAFQDRHIVEDNPTEEELTEWIRMSGLPAKRFFNTSGMKYRELGLKDRLPDMSEEEQIPLL